MAKVTIKHESEISNLKDEVERLKVIIKEMENKINSIMEKDMVKPEEAGSDYMEIEIGNAGEELSKAGQTWFNCDMCVYKCKTEKPILKHRRPGYGFALMPGPDYTTVIKRDLVKPHDQLTELLPGLNHAPAPAQELRYATVFSPMHNFSARVK